jgi:hypothetical protein
MHRPRQVILSLWGGLVLALGGCSVAAPKPVLVRSVYVEEAAGTASPELARCADVIHDTSVRVLRGLGYVAASEPTTADASLHATWLARPVTAGSPAGRVSLRMSLVTRDGTVLKSAEVITDAQAGFLTKERIADHIRTKLGAVVR